MKLTTVISVSAMIAMIQLMGMQSDAAIDCGQVSSNLAPCIPFLTGGDTSPSAACCTGVKNLKTLAPTTSDRRAACDCVKAAAVHYPNIKDGAASSLPKECGVDVNIPISKTTNCQTIN